MAFQNYKPGKKFSEQQWVGFKHFKNLFTDPDFFRVMKNTLGMSIINLVLSFVTAIAFALLLNELTGKFITLSGSCRQYRICPIFLDYRLRSCFKCPHGR